MARFAGRWSFPALAFAVPFAVYVATAAPGVVTTDSGELAGVCTTLGIAHPSGYPLFTLLGHAWTWLPLPGDPVRRLNLFAAFCTAVSAALFFGVARLVFDACTPLPKKGRAAPPRDDTARDVAALAAALFYAFARTVWQQATSLEVYALHLALVMAVLLLFFRAWSRTPDRTLDWLLFAGAVGLAFTNHLTTIVLAPALVVLFFAKRGAGAKTWRLLGLMALPFAAALLVYLYLPLRSAMHPVFDWGGVSRGLAKLQYHLSGKQYQVWMFSGAWGPQLKRFGTLLPWQLGVVGIVLAPFGIVRAFRAGRALGAGLLLLVLGPLAYAINYQIPDIDAYFLAAFAGLVLLAALGAWTAVQERREAAYALLVLPALALAVNGSRCDASRDIAVQDFVSNVAANVETGAVLVTADWEHFDSAFWYRQQVTGFRPDITLLNVNLLRRTWYPDQMARWYPATWRLVEPEVRAFLPELERFESGQPFDAARLQGAYEAVIDALIAKSLAAGRPVYVSPRALRLEPAIAKSLPKAPAGFLVRVAGPGAPPEASCRFDAERLAALTPAGDDDDTRELLAEAAAGVERCARYAAATGRGGDPAALQALEARLARAARSSS